MSVEMPDRGQTGVGATYAIGITLLMISGVLTVGYAYVSTPAVSSADTTTDSARVGGEVIYENLTQNYTLGRESAPPQLNRSKIEHVFPVDGSDGNPELVTKNSVVVNQELDARIIIENTTKVSSTSMLYDEGGRLAAGDDDPPASASIYEEPALLQQQLVKIKVKTWQEVE